MPMPAFAPSLRLSLCEGDLLDGVEVGGGNVRPELEVTVVNEDSVVSEVVDVELDEGLSVGTWPSCHSRVPPKWFGRLATGGMTEAAEKAAVMDPDSEAQVHWSPFVMVVGLAVSSQGTLPSVSLA
jgi:hypothetical protein